MQHASRKTLHRHCSLQPGVPRLLHASLLEARLGCTANAALQARPRPCSSACIWLPAQMAARPSPTLAPAPASCCRWPRPTPPPPSSCAAAAGPTSTSSTVRGCHAHDSLSCLPSCSEAAAAAQSAAHLISRLSMQTRIELIYVKLHFHWELERVPPPASLDALCVMQPYCSESWATEQQSGILPASISDSCWSYPAQHA